MMKVIASGVIALFGALFATASLAYEVNPSVMLIPSGAEIEYLEMDQIDLAVLADIQSETMTPVLAVLPHSAGRHTRDSKPWTVWRVSSGHPPITDQHIANAIGCRLPLRI